MCYINLLKKYYVFQMWGLFEVREKNSKLWGYGVKNQDVGYEIKPSAYR